MFWVILQADVIAPPKEVTENNVVDDFDIEEEEVAIQHRYDEVLKHFSYQAVNGWKIFFKAQKFFC